MGKINKEKIDKKKMQLANLIMENGYFYNDKLELDMFKSDTAKHLMWEINKLSGKEPKVRSQLRRGGPIW